MTSFVPVVQPDNGAVDVDDVIATHPLCPEIYDEPPLEPLEHIAPPPGYYPFPDVQPPFEIPNDDNVYSSFSGVPVDT